MLVLRSTETSPSPLNAHRERHSPSLTAESPCGELREPKWHRRASLTAHTFRGCHLYIRPFGTCSRKRVVICTHPISCIYFAKLIFLAMRARVSRGCACLLKSCGRCPGEAIAGRRRRQDRVRSRRRYDRCRIRGSRRSSSLKCPVNT